MVVDLNKVKYLFFVGSGRTGSTLVGQILNNHPSCLIANEHRLMQKVINNKESFLLEIKDLAGQAFKNYARGLGENKRYQKDWKDADQIIPKDKIKIIGDKKQGGNVQMYREKKSEFISLIESIGEERTFFIQVVRNPEESIKSYQVSHGYDEEKSRSKVLDDSSLGHEIISKFKNGKSVFYEDLLEDTESFLIDLCDYLGLEHNKGWIELTKRMINSDKKPNRSLRYKTNLEVFANYEKDY